MRWTNCVGFTKMQAKMYTLLHKQEKQTNERTTETTP